MEIYKKLYAITFGAISDALDHLPYTPENLHSRLILEKALLEAEEKYLQATEEEIETQ